MTEPKILLELLKDFRHGISANEMTQQEANKLFWIREKIIVYIFENLDYLIDLIDGDLIGRDIVEI